MDFVTTAFNTELGWMAVAQQDGVLAGVVFGNGSRRQAVDALRKQLERNHASALVDVVGVEDQPPRPGAGVYVGSRSTLVGVVCGPGGNVSGNTPDDCYIE
jgi:hypothetical protein